MSFLFRIQASGIANLRQYMRDSVLPSLSYRENDTILPPEGHASHANRLSVRPETYRRFDHMYGLEDEVWSAVHSCLDSLVPATRVGAAKDAFSIPARLQGKFRCNLDARPDHLHRLIPWVDRFPFATVKRILHLSIPETQAWSFQAGRPSHSEPDHDIFTYYTWSLTQTLNARPTARDLRASEDRRMLVAIQPPWIATQRDLEEFANSREFPPFMVPGDTFPEALPESKDRLWAKLWDCCAREKIHYFVVTSYTHWVFGVFTPGYSAAFTSPAIPHNNTVPTIVEMLTFWTISAMGIEGGYKPRHVPAPFFKRNVNIHPPRLPHHVLDPEESVSDWGGSSIESSEESAGALPSVYSFTQGECVYEPNIYSPTKKGSYPTVMDWLRDTLTEGSRSQRELETPDYQDPLEVYPYVVQVFYEPGTHGEEAAMVGNWLT